MTSNHKLRVYLFIAILFSMAQTSGAQTAMLADQTLRSNGRVNPSTLGLEMSVPLASYPGRGGMNVPISLQYSSKVWRMEYLNTDSPLAANQCHKQYTPRYGELSASGWTTDMSRPYIEYTGWDNPFDGRGNAAASSPPVGGCGSEENGPAALIRRITVHLPGGETHEFRPDDSVVSFWPNTPSTVSKDGTYYSADGSNLIYVEGSGTYRLKLPDGSYIDFAGSLSSLTTGGQSRTVRYALTHTDKTGQNVITYNAADSTYPNGSVTDSMGRVIAVPIGLTAPGTPTAANSPQEYQIPGFGSSTIIYKLHWKKLKDTTADESGLTNFSDTLCYKSKWPRYPNAPQPPSGSCMLFSDGYDNYPIDFVNSNQNDGVFNPIVLTKVELPDGRSYKFGYNIYGQMNRIEYPTGGFETLTHGSHIKTVAWETPDTIAQANFGVVQRKVYESSEADPTTWTYGITEQTVAPYGLIVRTTAPDNTKTDRYIIRGEDYIACMDDGSGMICNGGYGYASTLTGMSFEERILSPTDQLLSKTVTTWNETSLPISYGNGAYNATADWHPRAEKIEKINYDPATGGVLSASTTTEFQGDLNQRSTPLNPSIVRQYGFSTTTGALGSLEEFTETSYLSSTDYTSRNLRSLPSQVLIKDAAGNIKAKTQFSYDDPNFGVLGVYGLLTKTTGWHDIANNLSINSKVKYDPYGNIVESTDGNGYVTTTAFSSTYGYAYPTSVTTPVPDTNGTYGSSAALTTSTTYDFNTGLPTSTTDANGAVTTMEYSDSLIRPTKVTAPNGHETVTEYGIGTEASTRWVKVTSDIDETNSKYVITWLDGLGRKWLSQSEDSAGDVFAVTCYDIMGRVSKTSNPFRNVSNPTCASSLEWTAPGYDDLGRTITVTTPDGAVVETTYGLATLGGQIGTVVTVEDQAGRVRRSITNALGQLIRVDEPDNSTGVGDLGPISSPNQPTLYGYDTLNNLISVQQDGDTLAECGGQTPPCLQTRTFTYDALSRLKSAANPESGTINYTYDHNSNLATKTDARSSTTTYAYDALNRVKTTTYSDGTTPNVSYFYDNLTNAKGKLVKVSSSVSTTEYTAFDILGRVTAHKQTTDSTQYTTGYTYNLAGALIEETYPSGRKVKHTLGADGSLLLVETKPSGGSYATRANNFTYTAGGAVASMQMGNGRWESTVFNSRLQPTQVALGTMQNANDLLKLEYDYGVADNNGNILSQTITVPTVGQNQGFVATQIYTYDSLNRLKSAAETVEENQNLIQQGFSMPGPVPMSTPWCDPLECEPMNEPPVSVPGGPYSGQVGQNIQFNGSNSYDPDGWITQYYWTFGDGTTSTSANPLKSYASAGTYNVSLRVRDNSNVYDIASTTATIAAAPTPTPTPTPTPSNVSWKQTFVYDRFGNRNFDVANTTTLDSCPTAVCNPAINASNNRFASGQGYSYDSSGNTTGDAEGRQFTYDAENRQTLVKDASSATLGSYFFDGGGKRVKKTSNQGNVVFVYDAVGKLIEEYSGSTLQTTYVYAGSRLLTTETSTETNYLTADHLGSPRINTNQSGSVTARHDYMPFGEEVVAYGGRTSGLGYAADSVRKQFTGFERDNETDLDFAQARYHSFSLGRFSSVDPIYFQASMMADPQGFNLYVYVRNNPLKWIDPSGEALRIAKGSSLEELYESVGGKETFDKYFTINEDGLLTVRQGVDIRSANEGVRLLGDLIARPETFLFYSGADSTAVAKLFAGAVDGDGKLTKLGERIKKRFEEDGSIVATRGRPNAADQPSGNEIFAVFAVNSAGIDLWQVGNSGQSDWTTQYEGWGLRVRAVSLMIHELAENLDFAANGTAANVPQPDESLKKNKQTKGIYQQQVEAYRNRGGVAYNRAHDYAIRREAAIRRNLNLFGGFAGGSLRRGTNQR